MKPIKIDNLYPEEAFIRYCQGDRFESIKLGKRVTSQFLRAAEADRLIMPILVQDENVKTKDGTEKVEVRYYSPFQIFLVTALIENTVNEGVLRSPDNIDWQKEQNTRYVDWGGGHQFNVEIYNRERGNEPQFNHNAFSIADDFHQLLRLIHSLDPEERSRHMYEKRRLYNGAPLLTYDISSVIEGGISYLNEYGLDLKRIKRVLVSVGFIATRIDPLEHWHYYIKKHSQNRKDRLKGLASVAQDLYGFCDITYDIVKGAYKEELPPFLELLHPDIKPYMMDRAEYASGQDIETISEALKNLKEWVDRNNDLMEELSPVVEKDKVCKAISECEVYISDFKNRYGSRRYVGSTRRYKPSILSLNDLDADTKKMVESMSQQRIDIEEKEKGSLNEDKKQEIIAYEIESSIDHRLGEIGRAVSGVAYKIAESMWPLHHKAEREKEMAQGPAMEAFRKEVPRSDPEYARKHHEFWQVGMKEYQKPYQEKMDMIDVAQGELHNIGDLTRKVFCAACRKKLVQKRYVHTDSQISEEVVCDDCLGNETEKAMFGSIEDGKKMRYAEWVCDYCGDKVLLKFALGNTVSVKTQNGVPIQMVLKYGHVDLHAQCTKCGNLNDRPLDWGWTA